MANPSVMADLKVKNAKPKRPMRLSTRIKDAARKAAAKAERDRIRAMNKQREAQITDETICVAVSDITNYLKCYKK